MEQPEAAPDLVGRTSARLLAAGVDRGDRLAALHLLAILDASIDTTGRVRRPIDDLAAEFEIPPMSVMHSLDHLERAGAVQRDGGTVLLLGENTGGLGGMQLADFLEDVRASFDEAPVHIRRSPWLVRSGAALVAAAAAIAVVTLAPVSQPATTQTLAADATTSTIERVQSDPSAEIPVATIDGQKVDAARTAPALTPSGTDEIVAASTCPTGSPVATIVDGLIEITNPTDGDLLVTAFSVGGAVVRQPIAVAAGETVTRPLANDIAPIDASIESWEWSNADVARSCPQ